jgi:hypothetical protein
MKFRAKRPKSQGITASYHPAAVPHIRQHDGSLWCYQSFPFTTKRTKDTKDREIITFHFFLRALRDLRGDNVCFDFGWASASRNHPPNL